MGVNENIKPLAASCSQSRRSPPTAGILPAISPAVLPAFTVRRWRDASKSAWDFPSAWGFLRIGILGAPGFFLGAFENEKTRMVARNDDVVVTQK